MTSAPTADAVVELWLVAQPAHGKAREVAVETHPAATVSELARALADHVDYDGTGELGLFVRRTQSWLSPTRPVTESGLRSGDAVVVGTSGTTSDWGPQASRLLRLDTVELVVAGGPAAGARHGLDAGEHTVGRDPAVDVSIDDPSLSRAHLRVRVGDAAVEICDAGSRNGTAVEGAPLVPGEWRRVADGEIVEAGRSLLAFRRRMVAGGRSLSGGLVSEAGGRIPFNRPPRIERPFTTQQIAVEPPPDEPTKVRLPLAMSLVPLALGAALWALTMSPMMLMLAVFSPVMATFTYVSDRRGGKKSFERETRDFRSRLAEGEQRLAAAYEAERSHRRDAAPGPVELVERATEHASDLWERGPDDDDFLAVRVGTGQQQAAVGLAVEERGSKALRAEAAKAAERYASFSSVPIVAALRDAGALGLAGPQEPVEALARWLVVQTAVLHSPREVVVAAAVSEQAVERWDWLKWLPHTHSDSSPLGEAHLAARPDDVANLLESIRDLVRDRQREARERFAAEEAHRQPAIVLLLDEGVRPQRSLVTDIFGAGPGVGVYAIWLGRRMRDVPGDCGALAELAGDVARLAFTDASTGVRTDDVSADGIPLEVATEVTLALAPVRDTSSAPGRSGVPRRVSLADLLGGLPDGRDVAERWRRLRSDRAATIGMSADGIVSVDLRAHGPHGLIAGITGSGKSELLQTLVASLALEHAPERLAFLFVDYKGGAAFKECVDLPHEVGFVTDLDQHLTPLDGASFDASGDRIVTAGADGTVRVWDARSGRGMRVLRGHQGSVWSAAFSPDGGRIVSAGDDRTARIWDAHTGRVLRVLRGHDGSVYGAVWSPDGKLVLTASNDGTVRIWDAATGVTLTTLRGNRLGVYGVALDPAGTDVATAGLDGTLRIYRCVVCGPLSELRRRALEQLGRT